LTKWQDKEYQGICRNSWSKTFTNGLGASDALWPAWILTIFRGQHPGWSNAVPTPT
jgi:hypothetical protein